MNPQGLIDVVPKWIERVRSELASWYEASQRDLPWRKGGDPYHILVSEMMLVQTTVTAVIPFFERFLRRFPDPQSLGRCGRGGRFEGLGRTGVLPTRPTTPGGGPDDC